jgi:hypothetical protein
MRGRLLEALETDDLAMRIEQYLESLKAELVCSMTSDSAHTNDVLVSRGKICRQMLLYQLSDQAACILQTGI